MTRGKSNDKSKIRSHHMASTASKEPAHGADFLFDTNAQKTLPTDSRTPQVAKTTRLEAGDNAIIESPHSVMSSPSSARASLCTRYAFKEGHIDALFTCSVGTVG